jgi:hypothetical protein
MAFEESGSFAVWFGFRLSQAYKEPGSFTAVRILIDNNAIKGKSSDRLRRWRCLLLFLCSIVYFIDWDVLKYCIIHFIFCRSCMGSSFTENGLECIFFSLNGRVDESESRETMFNLYHRKKAMQIFVTCGRAGSTKKISQDYSDENN